MIERRRLVTLHLPIEMGVAARVMKAVAREYPEAVVSMEGAASVIWSRRLDPDSDPVRRATLDVGPSRDSRGW